MNFKEIKSKSIIRFWNKVKKTNYCWLWSAYKDKDGYGSITINNYPRKSHRISWELHNKREIPKEFCVLHYCDNPSCVNPDHLWLGTQLDNVKDREKKGRGADRKGENCPTAKLTWKKVKKIRELYETNQISKKELAKKYNVNQETIRHIILKESWRI